MAVGESGRPIVCYSSYPRAFLGSSFRSPMEPGVLGELAHEFRLAQGAFMMRSSWVNTGTRRSESMIVPFVETR
jgi:hypothetical protein